MNINEGTVMDNQQKLTW